MGVLEINSDLERSVITSYLYWAFFLHRLHKKWINRTIPISQQNRGRLLRVAEPEEDLDPSVGFSLLDYSFLAL